ncbi:MAG: hypothetical protein M0P91_04660 [Sulfuricurvum sp.]|jgi:hypothetical protein|uniref:hypothetical protein n=1 Tax=Sulfuricurvum sp. TaxID=2025608 RepID=UPI0025E274B8|nr:hypothetical protein [Sulfuricurvum sp.]MCK9372467.1 hypothetical protein [Sulfuricurvum sp.]
MKKENKIKEVVHFWIEPISVLMLFTVPWVIFHFLFCITYFGEISGNDYSTTLSNLGLDIIIMVSLLLFIKFLINNEIEFIKLNFVKKYIKSKKTFEETFLENKDKMIQLFKNKENFLSCVESVKKIMEEERIMKAKIAEYEAIEAKKLEDKFLGKEEER